MSTSDRQIAIADLQSLVVKFSISRGWDASHTPGELAKALVVESAELLEHFLWSPSGEHQTLEGIAEEMADVLIYLLNMAEVTGVDLAGAVVSKLAMNEARFPAGSASSGPS